MAYPVATSFSAASGQPIWMGIFAPVAPPIQTGLLGDSLTDQNLGNISPFHNANGMIGGLLQLIVNIGVYGNTVQQMLARIDNAYTDPNPGFGGLPPLGFVEFRGGTNNARGGVIGSLTATYDSLFAKLLTYAQYVIVKPVPPIGGSESAANANVPGYNAYLQAKCAASGGKLIWVDDCVNVKDGSGNQLPAFFNADGIHFSNQGVWQLALDSVAGYTALLAPFSYSSPISTDPADKYPAQPQWVPNHVNAGTSGSPGNMSGTLPNNWGLWANGGGITGAGSILASVDTNPVPWIHIGPTQVTTTGSGESIQLAITLTGRTITGVDPGPLEIVSQIRLNALDSTKINVIRQWMQGSDGSKITPDLEMKMGGGALTKTLTMRQKLPRKTAFAAAGATLYIELGIVANGSSALGFADFRCDTIRG